MSSLFRTTGKNTPTIGEKFKMTDYEKLEEIYNEIDVLIAEWVTDSTPSFLTWQSKLKRFLYKYYGENSYEYKDFENIKFKYNGVYIVNHTSKSVFNDACKKGLIIAKGILGEYLKDIKNENELDDTTIKSNKIDGEPSIFLSHNSKNKVYGDVLQKFIIGLGVKHHQLIYTSHSLHKIPLGENIYTYLRKIIDSDVFVIFLHSDSYYESSACLNEMGAAWMSQKDYSNMYVSNFNFENPKYLGCAIDKNKMGIKLDGNENCKTSFIELKDKIAPLFNLIIEEKHTSYLIDDAMRELKEII